MGTLTICEAYLTLNVTDETGVTVNKKNRKNNNKTRNNTDPVKNFYDVPLKNNIVENSYFVFFMKILFFNCYLLFKIAYLS